MYIVVHLCIINIDSTSAEKWSTIGLSNFLGSTFRLPFITFRATKLLCSTIPGAKSQSSSCNCIWDLLSLRLWGHAMGFFFKIKHVDIKSWLWGPQRFRNIGGCHVFATKLWHKRRDDDGERRTSGVPVPPKLGELGMEATLMWISKYHTQWKGTGTTFQEFSWTYDDSSYFQTH